MTAPNLDDGGGHLAHSKTSNGEARRGLQPVASASRPAITRAKAWAGLFQPTAGARTHGRPRAPKRSVAPLEPR
eukprot:2550957-Pyramimonas_sp.AAC.1